MLIEYNHGSRKSLFKGNIYESTTNKIICVFILIHCFVYIYIYIYYQLVSVIKMVWSRPSQYHCIEIASFIVINISFNVITRFFCTLKNLSGHFLSYFLGITKEASIFIEFKMPSALSLFSWTLLMKQLGVLTECI